MSSAPVAPQRLRCGALDVLLLDRHPHPPAIDVVLPLSSCGQSHRRKAAEAHFVSAPCRTQAKDPASCPGRRDLKREPVDPSHAPASRLDQPTDFQRDNSLALRGIPSPPTPPTTHQECPDLCRISADACGRRFSHLTYEKSPFSGLRSEVGLAEPEGFEPSMQVLPTYSLSRGAPSATRSQLRGAGFYRPSPRVGPFAR